MCSGRVLGDKGKAGTTDKSSFLRSDVVEMATRDPPDVKFQDWVKETFS